MHLASSKPAQTLLEAVLAIGVILVATISATTLIVTTISAGQSSEDKIVAANLAREGVEIVRGIRDSNWIKRAQNVVDGTGAGATTTRWDDTSLPPPSHDGYVSLGNATGKCYFAVYDINYGWFLTEGSAMPCTTFPSEARINQVTDAGQTYLTSQSCPSVCSPTKFSRMISIQLVSTDTNAGDYLDVRSTVIWNNHGDKTYVATERLYDWR